MCLSDYLLMAKEEDYLEIHLSQPIVREDRHQTILGTSCFAKLRSLHSQAKIYETQKEKCFIVNDSPSSHLAYPVLIIL